MAAGRSLGGYSPPQRRRQAGLQATSLALAASLSLLTVLLSSSVPMCAAKGKNKGPWWGVNWGRGLSSKELDAHKSVSIIKQYGFKAVKLFYPEPNALSALQGSGLQVMVAVPNQLIADMASSRRGLAAAKQWLQTNVVPYADKGVHFIALAVGNEILSPPADGSSTYTLVVPAMWNVYNALKQLGMSKVAVVTPQHTGFLTDSYPPSRTKFLPAMQTHMMKLLDFVNKTGSYMLINCYPFFPFMSAAGQISSEFANFKGLNGFYDRHLYYQNLFDAMLDGVAWAIEKAGYGNLPIVVGETGWATGGATIASVRNAARWNSALVAHVNSGGGTPKRPNKPLRAFLFEMFDEDRKDASPGTFELHWGLANMDGTPKYSLNVSATPTRSPRRYPPLTWCIANPRARLSAITKAMAWTCSPKGGGLDCRKVTAHCPKSVHATVVLNYWFQAQGQMQSACNFSFAAVATRALPIDVTRIASTSDCFLPGRPSSKTVAPVAATPSSSTAAPDGPAPSCPSQSQSALQSGLDYACGNGADCSAIQPGASCFSPNTLVAHASYAFSSYYSKMKGKGATCSFGGAATLVSSQPKDAGCTLPSVDGQYCVAAC